MTLIPKKAPYVTIKNLNSLDLSAFPKIPSSP